MDIIKLTKEQIPNVIQFCEEIKKLDKHPCSFWGYEEKGLNDYFDDKNIIHFVAISEIGKVVGLGKFERGGFLQEHFGEIGVATHPSFRKKGIAFQLIEKLELYASSLNLRFLKAIILENNLPSRTFFRKHGYEQNAILHEEFNIEGVGFLNDCVYHKKLT